MRYFGDVPRRKDSDSTSGWTVAGVNISKTTSFKTMTQVNTNEAEYRVEIIKAEYSEGVEFNFRADIRVKLYNPHGENVIVYRTYHAGPKYDDIVRNEEHIYSHADYWWPNAKPTNGDIPFFDQNYDWRPGIDLDDYDALLEECIKNATIDPQLEIEILKNQSDRFQQRLED